MCGVVTRIIILKCFLILENIAYWLHRVGVRLNFITDRLLILNVGAIDFVWESPEANEESLSL